MASAVVLLTFEPDSNDGWQMRHAEEFERFLKDEVDLNQTRLKTLTARVEAIKNHLSEAGWKANIISFSEQGSWAHKTIIKPPAEQGFDADLLVYIEPVPGWEPSDYIITLKKLFTDSKVYEDKAHLHTRCVRLEYAGDFEIDVVPCVVNRPYGTYKYEVCNRCDDEFEATDGEAYSAWFQQRNQYVGNDRLREVTRLLKYLRDIKTTFSCKSILLTTLLGCRIGLGDTGLQTSQFSDIPTALKTLINRLDDYLQVYPNMITVTNPVLSQENFNRHWDQEKYSNFRDMIHKYRSWIDDAYGETDYEASIAKWQRVFDDDWGKSLEKEPLLEEASGAALTVSGTGYVDWVQAVKLSGATILASIKTSLPWVKASRWQVAPSANLGVTIKATLHEYEGGPAISTIASGSPLQKYQHILFQACAANGMPLASPEYVVHWQVVNTERDAANANALRGGFYRSSKPGQRWEQTQYRGVHWVQAFVVRKRDGREIGRSERFFVVIE